MIELDDVSKVFADPEGNEVRAVDGLSLFVREGETVALIGTSGCGKTTTMKLINRLEEATAGQVRVEGTDVNEWSATRLRRRMGYVVQGGGLFPHMTVARNISLLCELEGWSSERRDGRVRELLDLVNLPPNDFRHRYPRELSGGERQRVSVARALALDPPCVLMDEPFGALDPITRDQIHREFIQLEARVKKTIVLVTHDMAEAFALADRVALMDAGRIVQVGDEEVFRSRPASVFVSEFLSGHLDGGGAAHG